MTDPLPASRPNRSWHKVLVSVGLAVIVVGLLVRQIHWHDLAALHLHWGWLAGSLAAYLLMQVARGWRLWTATRGARSPWRWSAVAMVQNLLLTVLPMRTGEVSFVALLAREPGIGLPMAGKLLIAVRLLDLAAVALMFVLGCLLPGTIPAAVRVVWPLAALVLALCMGVLLWPQVLAAMLRPPLLWLCDRRLVRDHRLAAKMRGLLEEALGVQDLQWLRRKLPLLVLQSVTVWALSGLVNLACLMAVGLFITPTQALYLTSVIVLSGVLPIHGLAGFGPLDAIGTGLLMSLGHTKTVAIPVQLTWHAQVLLLAGVAGLVGWLGMLRGDAKPLAAD